MDRHEVPRDGALATVRHRRQPAVGLLRLSNAGYSHCAIVRLFVPPPHVRSLMKGVIMSRVGILLTSRVRRPLSRSWNSAPRMGSTR